MLVLERTRPTKLMITGKPDELKEVEHLLDFFYDDQKHKEDRIDGSLVQEEIVAYLGVSMGALMLKHERKQRGLRRAELATALGLPRQGVKALETGKTLMSREIAEMLGAFFAVPAKTFLKYSNPK